MRKYKVVITPDAKAGLKKYLSYLRDKKNNPQAVSNVLEDFRETKESLCNIADIIAAPENEQLKKLGLKRLNFVKGHSYFLLFKISEDGVVYITDIFHMLEDFDNKLR